MEQNKRDEYYYKLKIFNETVWEHKTPKRKIDEWLNNFKIEEREDFLFLLTQFIYLSKFQINNMLISIYRDFFKYVIVEDFRLNNNNSLDESLIKAHFKDTLGKSRFVPLGNPSESSSTILYEFRKINNIKTELFIERQKLLTSAGQNIEHFIFIDDICGSGNQALSYNSEYINYIKRNFPLAKIHYYSLVGLESGLDKINRFKIYDYTDSVLRLDKSYKCFEADSRYFKNYDGTVDFKILKKLSAEYGEVLMASILARMGKDSSLAKDCALGYNDCQLLLSFHHNTPDNTLPIFWYNENIINWTPIFPRDHKV